MFIGPSAVTSRRTYVCRLTLLVAVRVAAMDMDHVKSDTTLSFSFAEPSPALAALLGQGTVVSALPHRHSESGFEHVSVIVLRCPMPSIYADLSYSILRVPSTPEIIQSIRSPPKLALLRATEVMVIAGTSGTVAAPTQLTCQTSATPTSQPCWIVPMISLLLPAVKQLPTRTEPIASETLRWQPAKPRSSSGHFPWPWARILAAR